MALSVANSWPETNLTRVVGRQGLSACALRQASWPVAGVLGLLLAAFLLLESLVPLRTAIQIGADEGFELAKAVLCLKGHPLYTEVWNDQPPLHTFLVTATLKYLSPSILGPRLITVGFAVVLLMSVFLLALRTSGRLVAAVAVGLVIASPGFIELSSSCMLEIPAVATAVAALSTLLIGRRQSRLAASDFISGILFGVALQLKLTAGLLLPVAGLLLWLRHRQSASAARALTRSVLLVGAGMALSFAAIHALLGGGAYFQQLWVSHLGAARSFEYGSASEHPFQRSILLKNWDATLPAISGVAVSWRAFRQTPGAVMPVAWLALVLVVHALQRPWWSYYYVHIALPLCWNAAIGLAAACRSIHPRKTPLRAVLVGLWVVGAVGWMGGRLYLQISGIRDLPQTYNCLVLKEIARYKPHTDWMYAAEPVYSFHAGIPLPPDLAVVPLKRLWSGQMNNAGIAAEMASVRPGIILLRNDAREVPFADLVSREYRLVYMDAEHLLYVHQGVARKARL